MYFDPGFGSMLIQIIVAGIAAVGVTWGIMKLRLKGIFNKKHQEKDENTTDDQL